MASGMAKIIMEANPDIIVKVVPGGGTANPSKVNAGKSQLGMGLDVFTFLAYNGREIYDGKPHKKLQMIGMSFSDNYMHFIRAKGADLSFEDVFAKAKDVNMAVTKAGSSDEQTFRWVMAHYGILDRVRRLRIHFGDRFRGKIATVYQGVAQARGGVAPLPRAEFFRRAPDADIDVFVRTDMTEPAICDGLQKAGSPA